MVEAFTGMVKEALEKLIEQPQTLVEKYWDNLEKTVEVEPTEAAKQEAKTTDWWDNLDKTADNFEETTDFSEKPEKIDDNGNIYAKNGELLPNTEYTLNGNIYKTDENGRIISWESIPQSTPENPRDNDAQASVGGEDRRPGDQGGHIVGRDMGGDGGLGNLVPMHARINQSDYKRMENEIKQMSDEGKDVKSNGEMTYNGDSKRPDNIITTVTTDGKDTVYTFDNNLDGSLMDKLKETCNESDIGRVERTLDKTGGEISSTKEEYNADGNLEKTTVTITSTDENGDNYRDKVIINHDEGIPQ